MKNLIIPAIALFLASCGAPETETNDTTTNDSMSAAVCEYTAISD